MNKTNLTLASTPADTPHGMALLRGLLPAHVQSMKAQAERILTNIRKLPNDLDRYVALNVLHDRNEALFFRVVTDNINKQGSLYPALLQIREVSARIGAAVAAVAYQRGLADGPEPNERAGALADVRSALLSGAQKKPRPRAVPRGASSFER